MAMFEKLSEYIDNELDTLTCDAIKQHLAHCAPCHACLKTLQRTVSLCRELPADPVPRDFSLQLKAFIHRMR
jgi:RNA polymerase sigma-70 factor (ECF subfamily)